MKTELNLNQQSLTLTRYPKNHNQTLQAWNAADEYLITEVEQLPSQQKSKILILNDSFGAISCAFHKESLVHSSDSLLSQLALTENLAANGLSKNNILLLDSLQKFPDGVSLVILKIPKTLAMLEYQLIKIATELSPNTPIIAASMVKQLHASTLKLFEKYIGPTTTSLAKKKARLVFSKTATEKKSLDLNNCQKSWQLELTQQLLTLSNNPNVFSFNGLDLGARFMLENLPQGDFQHIIDLGCGNGVLGLAAKIQNPSAKISFVDESYMAVDSAKTNWKSNFPSTENDAEFKVTDCLQGIEENTVDLILCNPPFHQQQTITDEIAMQMFRESSKILNSNGKLMVIGNRHLGYHIKLKKCFKHVKQIASNSKFVIILAFKV